jgi:hypothetical protein
MGPEMATAYAAASRQAPAPSRPAAPIWRRSFANGHIRLTACCAVVMILTTLLPLAAGHGGAVQLTFPALALVTALVL